jgi:Small-conductance mechanosensitive channel
MIYLASQAVTQAATQVATKALGMHEQLTSWIESLVKWIFTSGIKIVFIIIIAYVIKAIAKRFIQKIVKAAMASEKFMTEDAELKRMTTLVSVFSWTVNTLIFIIAGIMVIEEFGVNIAPILTGAGILGVAVGFGGQYLVKDVISGFFIIFENQYRIGDVIEVEGLNGTVEDISLRKTTLRDADGTQHYIPHGEIRKVSNHTRQFAKINLKVGVAYEANLDHVEAVVNKIGQEMVNDPAWKDAINDAPKYLRVNSLDDSSVSILITGETKPQDQWRVAGELRKRIKETFEKEGIDLPYPQTVVRHIQN